MNTVFNLRVNGQENPVVDVHEEIKFSWDAPEHLKQFTIDISPEKQFHFVQHLRDTNKLAYLYDGPALQPGKKFYWRVRSGMYEYVMGEFTTR